MMAVKPGLDLLDTMDIHDSRAMYPEELRGVEPLFKSGKRLAKFVVTIADVKTYVVAFSFDPVDVFRRDEQYSSVLGNRQPVRVHSRRGKPFQAGYDPVHLVAVELPSNSVLGASQSALKPLFADRFKQIVNGIRIEGTQGIAVVSCHKNRDWHLVGSNLAEHLESVHFRHLDIEKNEIGFSLPNCTDSGFPVA